MTDTIRILIADDHPIVREGLQSLLDSQPDLEVVATAVDGVEAVLKAREVRPDVSILDLIMPRKDGLDAIREIKQENPDARILVLTSFADDDKVFPAIKAGALGYLLKDAPPQRLLRAIRDVYHGEASLHPSIALKVVREIREPSELPPTEDPLTTREMEVLKLVARGLTNQEIAAELVISEWTVATHVRHVLGKLHLANRTQAALYAIREGFVDPGAVPRDSAW